MLPSKFFSNYRRHFGVHYRPCHTLTLGGGQGQAFSSIWHELSKFFASILSTRNYQKSFHCKFFSILSYIYQSDCHFGQQQSKKCVSINLDRKALSFDQMALSFQKRHSQQSQNNELQDNQKCLCWMAKLVLIG